MRQVLCLLLLVTVAVCFPAPQAPTFFFTSPVSPGVQFLSPPSLPQLPQPQPAAAPAALAPQQPSAAANPVFTATHFQAQDGLGQFRFGFANTDGQVKTEFRSADSVVGYYRYISPEGHPIEMSYTADKNGFQAQPIQAQPGLGQFQAGLQAPTATAAGPIVPPELAQAHAEANLRLAQAYRDAEVRLAAAKQKAAAEALANAIAGTAGTGAAAEGGEAGAGAGAQQAQQQAQQQIVGFPISFLPQFG